MMFYAIYVVNAFLVFKPILHGKWFMKVDDSPTTADFQGHVPEGMGIYCHLWAYDLCIYIYTYVDKQLFLNDSYWYYWILDYRLS